MPSWPSNARRAGTNEPTKTLYLLLQITDSLFPSGSFAHSYGLEGLQESRAPLEAPRFQEAIEAIWTRHLLRIDGLFGVAAHRAMTRKNVELVAAADRELFAMKLPRELREASVTTGRGFWSVAKELIPSPEIARFGALVESGRSPGTYAVVFQAAAAAGGIPEEEGMLGWGYQTIAQMTSSLLRLGMLGHREAQSLVRALRGAVERGIREILAAETIEASSFAPRLEVASMRHERQYSRLFRS